MRCVPGEGAASRWDRGREGPQDPGLMSQGTTPPPGGGAKPQQKRRFVPHETVLECQKGRVVKTTYQHFALDGRPCQNARWVVLTPCENSPFVSECIVALRRNGTLSALDGYIVTREFAHPVQHYHFDPERSTLDMYIHSQLNCGILTPNSTFTTRRCTHTQRGTFSP